MSAAEHIDPSNKKVALLIAVLASANVITGAVFLLWSCIGLGVAGLIFGLIGFFAPTALHL